MRHMVKCIITSVSMIQTHDLIDWHTVQSNLWAGCLCCRLLIFHHTWLTQFDGIWPRMRLKLGCIEIWLLQQGPDEFWFIDGHSSSRKVDLTIIFPLTNLLENFHWISDAANQLQRWSVYSDSGAVPLSENNDGGGFLHPPWMYRWGNQFSFFHSAGWMKKSELCMASLDFLGSFNK